MENDPLAVAIENNIFWCDTVVRTHKVQTQLTAGSWLHDGRVVPFYPRLISRSHFMTENEVYHVLAQLGPESAGGAIKDSYAKFDLDWGKYEVLFESRWIARRSDAQVRRKEDPEGEWNRISTIKEFQEWCSRWASFSNVNKERARDLFKIELLENPKVSFLRRRRRRNIAGVAIAYECADSIGISNFMGEEASRDSNWSSLANYLQKAQAKSLLVGYENGPDLAAAVKTGFEELGSLRVWINREQSNI